MESELQQSHQTVRSFRYGLKKGLYEVMLVSSEDTVSKSPLAEYSMWYFCGLDIDTTPGRNRVVANHNPND